MRRPFWLLPESVLLGFGYPALLLIAVAFCAIRPVNEPEIWFHMAFGRYVLENRHLPPGDIFSFTGEGNDWISAGWMSSLLFHWVYEHWRSAGLAYLVFGVTASIILSLYFVAVKRFANRGSVMLVLLPTILAGYTRFSPRPGLFSHLLMVAVLLLLATSQSGERAQSEHRIPRRLWLLLPIIVVWANFHGGFAIAFPVLALFAAYHISQWRKTRDRDHLLLLIPLALCFFVWLINPYGHRIMELASELEKIPSIKDNLFEWMPLFTFSHGQRLPWPTYLGVATLAGVAGWVLATQRKSVPWWQWAVVAGFVILEFRVRRYVTLSSYVIAAMLIPHLKGLDTLVARPNPLVPAVAILGLLFIGYTKYTGVLGIGDGFLKTGRDSTQLPVNAVDFLKENRPPANMFNTYNPGGYLLYFLGPDTKVFVDGRFFVYSPEVWNDLKAVHDQRMTIDQISEKYDIKTFFIYIRDDPQNPRHLGNRLTARKNWKMVYFSDSYAVFVKETPETATYTASRKFEYVSPFDLERLKQALANPLTRKVALEEIARAKAISRRSATSTALAGFAAQETGDEETAQRLLQEAHELYPGNFVLRKIYQRHSPAAARFPGVPVLQPAL